MDETLTKLRQEKASLELQNDEALKENGELHQSHQDVLAKLESFEREKIDLEESITLQKMHSEELQTLIDQTQLEHKSYKEIVDAKLKDQESASAQEIETLSQSLKDNEQKFQVDIIKILLFATVDVGVWLLLLCSRSCVKFQKLSLKVSVINFCHK